MTAEDRVRTSFDLSREAKLRLFDLRQKMRRRLGKDSISAAAVIEALIMSADLAKLEATITGKPLRFDRVGRKPRKP